MKAAILFLLLALQLESATLTVLQNEDQVELHLQKHEPCVLAIHWPECEKNVATNVLQQVVQFFPEFGVYFFESTLRDQVVQYLKAADPCSGILLFRSFNSDGEDEIVKEFLPTPNTADVVALGQAVQHWILWHLTPPIIDVSLLFQRHSHSLTMAAQLPRPKIIFLYKLAPDSEQVLRISNFVKTAFIQVWKSRFSDAEKIGQYFNLEFDSEGMYYWNPVIKRLDEIKNTKRPEAELNALLVRDKFAEESKSQKPQRRMVMDKNGDDIISFEEFREWSLGIENPYEWGEDQTRTMFNEIDENEDGLIDFEEFQNAQQKGKGAKKKLKKIKKQEKKKKEKPFAKKKRLKVTRAMKGRWPVVCGICNVMVEDIFFGLKRKHNRMRNFSKREIDIEMEQVCENLNIGTMTTKGVEKIIRPEEFDQQLQFGGKSKEEKLDLCDSIITQLDAELMQSFYEGKKSVRTFCKEYVHKTCPKPNFQFKNRKWEHKDDKFSHDEL